MTSNIPLGLPKDLIERRSLLSFLHKRSSEISVEDMKSAKIVFLAVVWVVQLVFAAITVSDDRKLEIPRYISSLIGEQNLKDPTRYHDVVLFRMEIASKSEIYRDILQVIIEENPDSPVLVHDSFQEIKHRCLAAASFFIIVSDRSDSVSFL